MLLWSEFAEEGKCDNLKVSDDLPHCGEGFDETNSFQRRTMSLVYSKYGEEACLMQQTCCSPTIYDEIYSLYKYNFNHKILDYFYDGNL